MLDATASRLVQPCPLPQQPRELARPPGCAVLALGFCRGTRSWPRLPVRSSTSPATRRRSTSATGCRQTSPTTLATRRGLWWSRPTRRAESRSSTPAAICAAPTATPFAPTPCPAPWSSSSIALTTPPTSSTMRLCWSTTTATTRSGLTTPTAAPPVSRPLEGPARPPLDTRLAALLPPP